VIGASYGDRATSGSVSPGLEAVALQAQVLDHGLGHGVEGLRNAYAWKPGVELAVRGQAAGLLRCLQQQHPLTATGQERGADKAVVARADDDAVVARHAAP
jgi:hypothetical protein